MNSRFESKSSKIIRLAILLTALGTSLAPTGSLAMGLSGGLTPNLQFPPKGAFADTAPSTCFLFFCTPSGDATRNKVLEASQQPGGNK